MGSAIRSVMRLGSVRDPHAPRRRKRRFLATVASLSDTSTLIYTLQTLLC